MPEHMSRHEDTDTGQSRAFVPSVGPPLVPDVGTMMMKLLILLWGVVALFLLDKITILLADYWFFQRVGLEETGTRTCICW